MALRDNVTNEMIEMAISEIDKKNFTTLEVIDILMKQEPDTIEYLHDQSPTHWRSVIGKSIKRYADLENKIDKIPPPSKKQANWKKRI